MNERTRKLDREQVAAIVNAYRNGARAIDLAAQYDVAPSAISYQVAKHTRLRRDLMLTETCGTYAGYQRHRTFRSKPCQQCKDAAAAYGRAYRQQKKERAA